MTKRIHRGAINKQIIEFAFKKHNYMIDDYFDNQDVVTVIAEKDYSKDFNIEFNGLIKLEVIIIKKMYDMFCVVTYPKFREISNIIPKKGFNHIYSDGSLCYAPPKRPLVENWEFVDFVSAVDSLIYNYFSIEYIGSGELVELEHGTAGLEQYEFISLNKSKRQE